MSHGDTHVRVLFSIPLTGRRPRRRARAREAGRPWWRAETLEDRLGWRTASVAKGPRVRAGLNGCLCLHTFGRSHKN